MYPRLLRYCIIGLNVSLEEHTLCILRARLNGKARVAPKLWNDLPLEIRMAKSVDTLKKCLNTHLFSKFAFHSWLGLLNTYKRLCNFYLFLFLVRLF